MSQRPKIFYNEAQVALMWDRWQRGESLHQIARLFERHHSSVRRILSATGGIRPAARARADRTLSLAEREEISRGLVAGQSIRAVASRLHRAPSTICREVGRNGGRDGYRANHADQRAWDCASRPKACKLARHRVLARLVASKLQQQWAPEQIAGWLKHRYPGNEARQVSHETIYQSLFIQARGALKKELLEHLRCTRAMRRSRHHTQKTEGHAQIVGAISIRERPAEVEDRAVPGHWEGDLLFGGRHSAIATLVERRSRFVMLVKLDGKDSETVVDALIKHARKLPHELYRSLTWDRGSELAQHQRFTLATDIKVYFCDPYNPWQRGSNENTNGLLRQYFPKGMDLSEITQAQLNAVAKRLNGRPRKTLNFETPAERFHQTVATTG
jgi:IS30 family transposase